MTVPRDTPAQQEQKRPIDRPGLWLRQRAMPGLPLGAGGQ